MSFSFRDRGRLSDRLRGKTCDEILRELRDHLHQDRNMSFDSTPSWGGFSSSPVFSRAGFPFMDQNMMHRPDMRAHFEDLANRHPEFADHLRPTAWGTAPEMDPRFFQSDHFRQHHPSGGSGSGTFQEDGAIPIPVIHEDSGGGDAGRGRTRKIPQYGLRNTVDLGESQKANPEDKTDGDARSQRSWSAPPDNRTQGDAPNPKRFVTRVDINDKNNQPVSGGNEPTLPCSSGASGPGKPPPVPKTSGASSPQSQPQTSKSGNVRHIPIFVEGRDQPVLSKPRNGSHSFASSQSSSGFGQPNYSYSYAQAPPGHHSSSFASSHASSSPPLQRRSQTNFPQASKPQTQPQPQPPPAPQEPKPTPARQPQAPPKPAMPKDPIAKVQAIQAEVNELMELIVKFSGNRTDKEYIYLDEMLTRNLIKLDDIETEGKENIRQARKEAIRSIQRCISLLESKAPLPQDLAVEGGEASMDDENQNEAISKPEESTEKSDGMGEGQTMEKMEVECAENRDSSVTSESHSEQNKDVAQDREKARKAEEMANISENQQQLSDQSSEKVDVVSDQPLEKMEVALEQEKMEVVSEQPPEKMEIVSDQTGENMDVISEQPVSEFASQANKKLPSSVETSSDKCSSGDTNTPENANTETELGSIVNEQPCAVIADTTVVPETVKDSEHVEAPSEVQESADRSANPQDLVSSSGGGDQKNEVTHKVVEESTQSVVPPKEDAEKVVSS